MVLLLNLKPFFNYKSVKSKLYRENMFFMRNSFDLNNRDMQPGQTLFQYLKRKKHVALKQSVQSSLQSSHLKPKEIQTVRLSQIQSRQPQTKQSVRQPSTKRKNRKSSHKKKKVDHSFDSKKQNDSSLMNLCHDIFKDQKSNRRSVALVGDFQFQKKNEPVTRKTPTRSFMSMISPLKNKSSSLSNTKPIFHKQSTSEWKNSNKMAQFCTKKMIKQTMSKVQKHHFNQVDFEKEMKDKLREFFILLNSVLVQLEDMSQDWISDGLAKKMKLLRSNMKLINGFVMGRQINQKQDINGMIDSLYTSINQVLDSYQGQVKSQSQNNAHQKIQKYKNQYEAKIQELIKDKNRLNRQLNASNKQYQKLQKEYDKLLEKFNNLEERTLQKTQKLKFSQKQITETYELQIKELTLQNNRLSDKLQTLQKKLKDSEYRFDQYVRKVGIQNQQKINQRQSYLLRQMDMLKSQCARDIQNLNRYYLNREQLYPQKIKNLQSTLSQQNATIKKLQSVIKQTNQILKLQQVNVKQSKRKADDLLIDLYRINQELYKHWIALKDVKTLLSRLNLFDKFQRIYKDIPFDDLLFLP